MEGVAREGFIKNLVFFEKDKRLSVEQHRGGSPTKDSDGGNKE